MKKIIIFLLLILSISIFSQVKKEYKLYLISNEEILLSYNDDIGEEDEDYDMDEYDSEEEDPYYWETYIEDDTVENDMDLYEDLIEDDTEKNMSDFTE